MAPTRPTPTGRFAAAVCAIATLVGATMIILAMGSATDSSRGLGYVSEAGVVTSLHASSYRIGALAIAAGLLLLALATARESRLAAALLVVSGLAATVSGSVPCSAGCPLPPYESATRDDLVHGGASIIAVATFALALAALALWGTDRALRWISGIAFGLLAPTGITIAILMLAVGRGSATALLERAILLTALLVTVLVSCRIAFTAPLGAADSTATR